MAVEVAGHGVVFGEGQFGAERFGLDQLAVLVNGRREFVVAGDLQTDALRDFEVGILAQVLDAVDEFAREGFADERGRQLGFERDDLVALDGNPIWKNASSDAVDRILYCLIWARHYCSNKIVCAKIFLQNFHRNKILLTAG